MRHSRSKHREHRRQTQSEKEAGFAHGKTGARMRHLVLTRRAHALFPNDELATDVAELARRAIMFRWIVPKMHETQTFLATIKNDHWNHENAGRYLHSRAAHDYRGGL